MLLAKKKEQRQQCWCKFESSNFPPGFLMAQSTLRESADGLIWFLSQQKCPKVIKTRKGGNGIEYWEHLNDESNIKPSSYIGNLGKARRNISNAIVGKRQSPISRRQYALLLNIEKAIRNEL
uniref:Uncharacterized protein n=1 Tax=Caenorhabditis japonica TaxID=281687 RepID=A0A8R1EKM9_CAEJA